jgi:uncharacterized protein YciI
MWSNPIRSRRVLYAIICDDVAESQVLRGPARPAHLARLQILQDHGQLLLAGPHPAVDGEDPGDAGFTGSLIVAEFPSLAAAEAWAEEDPYRVAGVYARVTVKPFKRVFPR